MRKSKSHAFSACVTVLANNGNMEVLTGTTKEDRTTDYARISTPMIPEQFGVVLTEWDGIKGEQQIFVRIPGKKTTASKRIKANVRGEQKLLYYKYGMLSKWTYSTSDTCDIGEFMIYQKSFSEKEREAVIDYLLKNHVRQ